MKIRIRLICILFSTVLLSTILIPLSGCSDIDRSQANSSPGFFSRDIHSLPDIHDFRDIPNISNDEIKAVEELLAKTDYFIYGMLPSTEAFMNANGEIDGYTALFCEWLTKLFGVPFIPRHYSWLGLLEGLESGEIDFTGELTPTESERHIYYMTDPMAQRSLKYFYYEHDSFIPENQETLPRYILPAKTSIIDDVTTYAGGTFEPIYISEYEEAYELLKSGEADALIAEGVQEAFFDSYNNISSINFFPLIYSPVSFSTQNQSLEPIIHVMQKALTNDVIPFLTELHDQGYRNYLRQKLYLSLTTEEIEYIKNNPVIYLGAEYDNYPISFYSDRYNAWQGVAFDVLDEVLLLTGLEYQIVNKVGTGFHELLQMLYDGKIHMLTEVIRSPERESLLLWPNTQFKTERSVLISKLSFPNIDIHRIYAVRVGLSKGTAHTEFFFEYFPNHPNAFEYEGQDACFQALERGEIDVVMNSYSTLQYLTNYLEQPDFKANYIFDNSFESTFGINKEYPLLCSIIDKSLALIDASTISEQWLHRSYDYRLRLVQAQIPWLIGVSILSICVLVLVAVLWVRSRRVGKRLETLVGERTKELALQTVTLTTLFDSIPDIIFTKDTDLRFMHCNKAFLEHFGLKANEIIGRNDETGLGFTDEIVTLHNEEDLKAIHDTRVVTVEEYIPSANGTNPLYETVKVPLMLEGEAIGIVGIAHDITKLKEMENVMAARYDYANKLSDALARITESPAISEGNLKSAADVITKEGCLALSTHRVSIWSFTDGLATLKNISCYQSDNDQSDNDQPDNNQSDNNQSDNNQSDNNQSDNNHVDKGKHIIKDEFDLSNRMEISDRLKTGRLIITNDFSESSYTGTDSGLCAMLDAPIHVDGKLVGVVCVEQNRTEEYREKREWLIEEQNFTSSLADLMALAISGFERRMARDEAERANKAKSSFLANMSHEIRTPMNAILGITEILIQNDTLPPDIENGLSRIHNSSNLLLGIINDILDFSKIEAGKLEIIPNKYKIASLINDSVQLNMMRLESKNIDFELQIDENLYAKLIGDELRIKQILNNLLSNAFKYTDSGKVTLSVSFQPMTNEAENSKTISETHVILTFNVQDTGRGMKKEQLEKLFDEYARFNLESGSSVEGTGLGLSITRRLVTLMNGDINAQSEYGVGSLFTVSLPQELVDDEILGKEVAENLRNFQKSQMMHRQRIQIIRDPMPYGKVLVVDDMENNLYVAIGLMKPYRLQIDTVISGKEAIERVKRGKVYDIIFMDHMMPEMDGIEAVNHIRDLDYKATIVALTANAVAGQADIFLKNGFDDFISKPIDIRQLNAVLNKYIRDKQPREVIESARRQMKQGAFANKDASTHKPADSMLIESFNRDAHRTLNKIEELYEMNDFNENEEELKKFTIYVHGMKNSLTNINEKLLAEMAYRLELAARERNLGVVGDLTPEFIKALRKLLEKLEDKSHRNIMELDDDIEFLHNKLLAVQELCMNYNRKGALDILGQVKDGSKETFELIDKLKELVLQSDFDEAEQMVTAYMNELAHKDTTPEPDNEHESDGLLLNKEVAGMDITRGLERYGYDERMYLQVLRSYALNVHSTLEVLEEVNEHNLHDYRIRVHGIKGSSFDIFAEEIGKAAAELEKAAINSDFDFIIQHNASFIEAVQKFIADIDNLLHSIDEENSRPKKSKPDSELLSALLVACEMYQMNEADEAMSEIEKYEYTNDDGLVNWLRECFDKMDFPQIVEKLSQIKNKEREL